MSKGCHGGPVDPIYWPAFGMPEGVEVEFSHVEGWQGGVQWDVGESGGPYLNMMHGGSHVGVQVDGCFEAAFFPVLETVMRVARAIEAGEVKLP